VLQVERLSGLVERAKELTLDAQLRLDVINSSVNIHTRIVKFFELVENDLYGKLQSSSAQIAVYRG
jgi:ariadne-1